MNQLPPETALPSHLVAPLLRFAARSGVTLDLTELGLPSDAATLSDVPIHNARLGRLFDVLAERLEEPHLGLLLPSKLEFDRYQLPELAARASPTLREAMGQFVRRAAGVHPSVVFGLEEADGVTRITHRVEGHPRGLSRHLNEFALASMVHHGRLRTGTAFPVREVQFIHPRVGSLDPLETYFGTGQLRFGCACNALVVDAATLEAAQVTADPRLLATLESLPLPQAPASTRSFSALVEARVRAELESGVLRLRRVARELNVSTRTLQRRLGEEGTSHAALLDRVRAELAQAWVGSSAQPLSEIAFRLGFSEFATFARAFKRWTGSAPGAYRAKRSGPS